jgi:hypothetical protein
MKLILRLVGYSEIIDEEKYFYQIYYEEQIFNFEILKSKFSEYHIITNEELDNCTVTCNSKNLKKETLEDESNTIYRLFIFSGNLEIRNKLVNIFVKFGEKSLINQQIMSVIDDTESSLDNLEDSFSLGDPEDNIQDLSSESEKSEDNKSEKSEDNKSEKSEDNKSEKSEDNKSEKSEDNKSEESEDNKIYDFSSVELNLEILNDPDFLYMIRIYKNKPELFKDFYKYISSSYLVKFEHNSEIDYSNNLQNIKNMNLNFTDDEILNSLKLTNNHINLALRCLITTKS